MTSMSLPSICVVSEEESAADAAQFPSLNFPCSSRSLPLPSSIVPQPTLLWMTPSGGTMSLIKNTACRQTFWSLGHDCWSCTSGSHD